MPKKEIYGNHYLRPLRHLREYIPQLQLLNYQGLNPKLSNPNTRVNLEAKIDANFQSMANTYRQLWKTLLAREKLNDLYKYWQNFQLRSSQCT
ncbi:MULTISPECIES: hypothetical protein [unclassified Microcoleus]|uniref:hypothetical protein n=1 Tax=unclassified Microcoleus TaxID=2642155 RepID=UPI002FD4B066